MKKLQSKQHDFFAMYRTHFFEDNMTYALWGSIIQKL